MHSGAEKGDKTHGDHKNGPSPATLFAISKPEGQTNRQSRCPEHPVSIGRRQDAALRQPRMQGEKTKTAPNHHAGEAPRTTERADQPQDDPHEQ